jgi:transcription elongation factor Elf1
MKIFYENPTQVIFADPDNWGEWIVGIAYEDKIICACCGGVFEIEDVVEIGFEAGLANPIHSYSYWVDVSNEIRGSELPDSLRNDLAEDVDYDSYDEEEEAYEAYFFECGID